MSIKRRQSISVRQSREKALMIEQMKKTPIIQICCEKLGIGRTTYYDWRRCDDAFAKAADDALMEGMLLMNDLAESQLLSAVRDGNLGAITYWLKHRHHAYSSRLEVTAKIAERDPIDPEQEHIIREAIRLASLSPSLSSREEASSTIEAGSD